ncbi:MAG: hypothetical protein IJE08_02195 [Clostridia bacterium]|nr:hypothetical protein [Clostridia bacterium]
MYFMVLAPFIVADGSLNPAKHLFAAFADRRAQCSGCFLCIPVVHIKEFLSRKVFVRVQPAPCHDHVGNACFGGAPEGELSVEFIVLLEERIVNDAEQIAAVILPVIFRHAASGVFDLADKAAACRRSVFSFQHIHDRLFMLRAQFPLLQRTGIGALAGIGDVEYVFQPYGFAGSIEQGNTSCAAPYISPHGIVPEIIGCAGSSIRPLGINHELFVVRVFVQPGGSGQEGRPVFAGSRDAASGVVCYLNEG